MVLVTSPVETVVCVSMLAELVAIPLVVMEDDCPPALVVCSPEVPITVTVVVGCALVLGTSPPAAVCSPVAVVSPVVVACSPVEAAAVLVD